MRHLIAGIAMPALLIAVMVHVTTFLYTPGRRYHAYPVGYPIADDVDWAFVGVYLLAMVIVAAAFASIKGGGRMTHLSRRQVIRGNTLFSGLPSPARFLVLLLFLNIFVQLAVNWSELSEPLWTNTLPNLKVASAVWIFVFLLAMCLTLFPPMVVPSDTDVEPQS